MIVNLIYRLFYVPVVDWQNKLQEQRIFSDFAGYILYIAMQWKIVFK